MITPSPPSSTSSSPPRLDPATLALLDSFIEERDERQREFDALEEEAAARLAARVGAVGEGGDDDGPMTPMMDVDTFRYSASFASHFANFLRSLLPAPSTTLAFLCAPTAYVGFQHAYSDFPNTKLLEYDTRFAILGGRNFVRYDLDEPEKVPTSLRGTVELAVADPPFLNEVTNRKLSRTLSFLLHPTKGRLILLTSTSVSSVLPLIYSEPPLGPLVLSPIKVEHAGGIANDFGVWTSWPCEDFGAFFEETEEK